MPLLGQYEYIIDKEHPRANEDGLVYLHVVIAENMLGRHLFAEEVVHHKDLNKLNNDPDNLMVFATKSDHTRFHMNGCDENMLLLNSNGSYVCIARELTCIDCGTAITRYGTRCPNCASIYSRKTERPTSDELFSILLLNRGNFTKVSKMYGVTDNAIRKWCILYDIPYKSKDYKLLQ